jgi:quercetin dioxygenase-like cupin family protein
MKHYNFEQIEPVEKAPGVAAKIIHSERMTVVQYEFAPDTHLPEHSHPHEQIAMVKEGEFELTVNGQVQRLSGGDVLVIPPDAPHSGHSITEARVMDIFSPVREDLK